MVSYHPANFDTHRYCVRGEMFITSGDLVFKGLYDLIGGSPS